MISQIFSGYDRSLVLASDPEAHALNLYEQLNATHAPSHRSWGKFAKTPNTVLLIQNLLLGIFSGQGVLAHLGIAIGDEIPDVGAAGDAVSTGVAKEAAIAAPWPVYAVQIASNCVPAKGIIRGITEVAIFFGLSVIW